MSWRQILLNQSQFPCTLSFSRSQSWEAIVSGNLSFLSYNRDVSWWSFHLCAEQGGTRKQLERILGNSVADFSYHGLGSLFLETNWKSKTHRGTGVAPSVKWPTLDLSSSLISGWRVQGCTLVQGRFKKVQDSQTLHWFTIYLDLSLVLSAWLTLCDWMIPP